MPHLQGGAARTGDPKLTNKGFNPLYSIFRIKLRDHESQVSFFSGWHLRTVPSVVDSGVWVPESSSRTKLLNLISFCHWVKCLSMASRVTETNCFQGLDLILVCIYLHLFDFLVVISITAVLVFLSLSPLLPFSFLLEGERGSQRVAVTHLVVWPPQPGPLTLSQHC